MPQIIISMLGSLIGPLLTAETAKFLILKLCDVVITRYEVKAEKTPDKVDDAQAEALREGYEYLKDKWSQTKFKKELP